MIDQITLKLYVLVNMKAFIDWISGIRAFVDLISGVKGSNASLSISSCCVRLQMRMSSVNQTNKVLNLHFSGSFNSFASNCSLLPTPWNGLRRLHMQLEMCWSEFLSLDSPLLYSVLVHSSPQNDLCRQLTLNFHIRKTSDLDSRFISHPHWTILMAAKSGREQNL